MKIITWNCNGKFQESFKEIIKENADIYVIQECGNPSESKSDDYRQFASNYFWVGANKHRGLGIFARDEVNMELVDLDDEGLRYFIPVKVNDDFNLLGIWTNPDMEGTKVVHYPKEVTKYYEEHKDSGFFNEDMIMCGDFNCDVRLVNKTHGKNVYEMMDKLSEVGLVDVYHYLNDEIQGEESKSTFFMNRKLEKPFHLDHVFASPDKIKDLEIPEPEYWMNFSDHVPIIFEI
ncbi:endonuclease/exonuclease/phosphatase family protein [Methanobrevibacter sp.]|uniref:endonuclease/exonuclease/phosphatase family protein n=1 Tax=Methanobrevibacter sp. TaxID=66852 RepID=UPI00386E50EA